MNSTLKLVLPIGLVALIAFGVTFISSYSPSTSDPEYTGPDAARPAQLLRLSRIEARYNPLSDDPAARYITGIYEQSSEEHPTSFWFQNVNPYPVRVRILERSCTSCTAARVGTLPAGAVTDFVTRKNVGLPPVALGFGGLPVPDVIGAVAAAALVKPIPWNEYDFDKNKDETTEIPPGSDAQPTWGVFQFGVKVGAVGPVARHVVVGLQAGTEAPRRVTFTMHLVGTHAFNVTPTDVNFGEVSEESNPRQAETVYWSATRGPSELPPPEVRVPPNDPLVAVGGPVPMTESEKHAFAVSFQTKDDKVTPPPVLAAWRIPITLLPKPAPAVPDIGPFERTVAIIGPGTEPGRVNVRGTITGLVALKEGSALKFGQYDGRADASRTVTLASSRTDLELETVPAEFKPVSLKVDLSPPSTNGARREWTMKVTIPADTGYGDLVSDAAVVLKTRDANPRRIRIPMSGTSFRR